MTALSPRNVVGVIAIAVVAVAVVGGLMRVGPPSVERERRLDERRVEDLRLIADAIDLHWTRSGSLPPSLDALPDTVASDASFSDPASGQSYEYRALTESTFELCASFGTDELPPSLEVFWSHPVGRHCFDLEVREVKRDEDEDDEDRPAVMRPARPLR